MIYISLDTNKIKLLFFKKTLMGQYEIGFFAKKHEAELLNKGKVINVDLVASAIKESQTLTSGTVIKEKEVTLILPQEAFDLIRIMIPSDIAETALNPFIKDKVRNTLKSNIEDCYCDYIIKENNDRREVLFFAITKETTEKYRQSLSLLDLKLVSILPVTLSRFKLFEKTLRREKGEKIFYVHYDQGQLSGNLYDSLGPLNMESWLKELTSQNEFENSLKQKVEELETEGIKLNRLIISGMGSETIRQDTFTKTIGVWTNLLKRIIPNFYQDYLKLIITQNNEPLPFLELDDCFGAFVFFKEDRSFSMLKNNSFGQKIKMPGIKIKLPLKTLSIFIFSFIISFVFFSLVPPQKLKLGFNSIKPNLITTPTPQKNPTPTITPTPTIVKEKLKIKVMNGSGIAGKAAYVVDLLKNKGYQDTISGGNADSFDYEITEIKIKKNNPSLTNVIKNDLKDYLPDLKSVDLDESENSDIIIIIGSNFK